MSAFIGCAVALPEALGIPLPGSLPQFTVHRILLMMAWFFLAKNGYFSSREERVPYLRWLLIFGFAQMISFLGGVVFFPGLKGCVDYALEAVLFFVLVTVYVQREGTAVRLLGAVCGGLAAAAAVAVVQKYSGINLVALAVPASVAPWMETYDISSTYPHRILFGYAMAMGVPLALALAATAPEPRRRRGMYAIVLLLIAAAYFSSSRGPWIGMALGVATMGVLGGGAIRKKLAVVALLAGAVLVLRPGVRDTISDLTTSTFEQDSLKGASYQFRWRLWDVAWTEVRRSPERFLFGYGPVSTESMDFTGYWEGQEGASSSMEKLGYTSWDNNYAADLIELGVVGFALQLAVFALIAAALWRNWRQADPDTRVLRAAVGSACLIFMFAMTNVFIFSPQLKYLFWALAAIGCNHAWRAAALAPEIAEAELEPTHPIVTRVFNP